MGNSRTDGDRWRTLVQTGHDKRLAAVAQTEMGHMNLLLDTAQQDMFFAPVELEGIARREIQRSEGHAAIGPRRCPERISRIGSR